MSLKRVLKISHLPEDFTESKLKDYAKQFGCTSVRVYMPRSHDTFKSRGYAFIQVPKEVSQPLLETLHNKFMFNKVLKCVVIPNPSKKTFRKTSLKPFSKSLNEKNKRSVHLEMRKKYKGLEKASKLRKKNNLKKKLKLMGDYEFTPTV